MPNVIFSDERKNFNQIISVVIHHGIKTKYLLRREILYKR